MLQTEFGEAYAQLRAMAAARVRADGTLSPTALVNELFLKLSGNDQIELRSHQEFMSLAAKAMRQIAIDYARSAKADKRGGANRALTLTDVDGGDIPLNLLDLDQALRDLADVQPGAEGLVELKFFAGMTLEEIAEVTEISLRTVNRRWAMARAFLNARLEDLAGS